MLVALVTRAADVLRGPEVVGHLGGVHPNSLPGHHHGHLGVGAAAALSVAVGRLSVLARRLEPDHPLGVARGAPEPDQEPDRPPAALPASDRLARVHVDPHRAGGAQPDTVPGPTADAQHQPLAAHRQLHGAVRLTAPARLPVTLTLTVTIAVTVTVTVTVAESGRWRRCARHSRTPHRHNHLGGDSEPRGPSGHRGPAGRARLPTPVLADEAAPAARLLPAPEPGHRPARALVLLADETAAVWRRAADPTEPRRPAALAQPAEDAGRPLQGAGHHRLQSPVALHGGPGAARRGPAAGWEGEPAAGRLLRVGPAAVQPLRLGRPAGLLRGPAAPGGPPAVRAVAALSRLRAGPLAAQTGQVHPQVVSLGKWIITCSRIRGGGHIVKRRDCTVLLHFFFFKVNLSVAGISLFIGAILGTIMLDTFASSVVLWF